MPWPLVAHPARKPAHATEANSALDSVFKRISPFCLIIFVERLTNNGHGSIFLIDKLPFGKTKKLRGITRADCAG
jgi:hypothetical protein